MESPDQRRNRNSRDPEPCNQHAATGAPRWRAPTNAGTETAATRNPATNTPRPERHDGEPRPTPRPKQPRPKQPQPTCRPRNRVTGWPQPEQPQPECRGPETLLPEGRSPLPRRRPKNGRNGVRSRTKPVEGEPRGRSDRPEREKTENRSDFFRFGGTEFVHLFLILPQHPDKPRAYSVS